MANKTKSEIVFNEGRNITSDDITFRKFLRENKVVVNNNSNIEIEKIKLEILNTEKNNNKFNNDNKKNLSMDDLNSLNKYIVLKKNNLENLKLFYDFEDKEKIIDIVEAEEKINSDEKENIDLENIKLENKGKK